jgi:hypothetical protein
MTAPNAPGPRSPLDTATLAEFDDELRASFAPGAPHRAVVQQMVHAEKFPEAVKFVAFSLPRREGVWWAWVTAKRAAGTDASPPVKACLDATERWIAQPTDANRRTAFDLAQAAELGTPAGCAAAAAFFAGESIAPPNVAAVPPGPYDCNKMIANAVILAAVITEPETAPDKFLQSLQQGLDVIGKIKVWPGDDGAPLTAPAPREA